MTCVRLWLNDPHVGAGERIFFVIKRGRKFATLLYVPLLAKVSIPVSMLNGAETIDLPTKKLLRTIRAQERDRKRLGLSYSKTVTREAINQLIEEKKHVE